MSSFILLNPKNLVILGRHVSHSLEFPAAVAKTLAEEAHGLKRIVRMDAPLVKAALGYIASKQHPDVVEDSCLFCGSDLQIDPVDGHSTMPAAARFLEQVPEILLRHNGRSHIGVPRQS